MHRILVDHLPGAPGETLIISGDEAQHALRVKRVRAGEAIELLDGQGTIASARAIDALTAPPRRRAPEEVHVIIDAIRRVPPLSPRIEVWSATPKGPRLDDMIDQLSQIGVACWRPLSTERSIVDPRDTKLARLDRILRESAKQCARAWLMQIGDKASFAQAIAAEPGTDIILADASGAPLAMNTPSSASPAVAIRLLIGPEGGWTPAELAAARAANGGGVHIHRFGPHIMRLETAAVAAAGCLAANLS